jgi:hypothetical protein
MMHTAGPRIYNTGGFIKKFVGISAAIWPDCVIYLLQNRVFHNLLKFRLDRVYTVFMTTG